MRLSNNSLLTPPKLRIVVYMFPLKTLDFSIKIFYLYSYYFNSCLTTPLLILSHNISIAPTNLPYFSPYLLIYFANYSVRVGFINQLQPIYFAHTVFLGVLFAESPPFKISINPLSLVKKTHNKQIVRK